jgi:hypothetical protein
MNETTNFGFPKPAKGDTGDTALSAYNAALDDADSAIKTYVDNTIVAQGVTNGDSHDHAGGDGGQIDHASLANKGANTHAQIDTHLGNTSNPHSVTKAQVTLGNVTNDAQLKRAAGDFAIFTEKPTPVDADVILIEDSEEAGAKKKVQLINLPFSSAIGQIDGGISTSNYGGTAKIDGGTA